MPPGCNPATSFVADLAQPKHQWTPTDTVRVSRRLLGGVGCGRRFSSWRLPAWGSSSRRCPRPRMRAAGDRLRAISVVGNHVDRPGVFLIADRCIHGQNMRRSSRAWRPIMTSRRTVTLSRTQRNPGCDGIGAVAAAHRPGGPCLPRALLPPPLKLSPRRRQEYGVSIWKVGTLALPAVAPLAPVHEAGTTAGTLVGLAGD